MGKGARAVAAPRGGTESPRGADEVWREEEGKKVVVQRAYHRKVLRKDITMAEVAKHNTLEDLWMCIDGRAYDVTKYAKHHPGGERCLVAIAGGDATDAFENYHPARVRKVRPGMDVGDIADYEPEPFEVACRNLRQDFLRRGLFETRPSF